MHRPLTDFWRVGKGYAKKLEAIGIYTMGDIARCSIGKAGEYYNEALLYKLFGINAELLIDHAWGWEPCRISDIKAYRPETNCVSSGQVLQSPYAYDKARRVVREMAEAVALNLLEKHLVTDQVTLMVGYDIKLIILLYKVHQHIRKLSNIRHNVKVGLFLFCDNLFKEIIRNIVTLTANIKNCKVNVAIVNGVEHRCCIARYNV